MEIGYLWLIPMIFLWTVRWTPITNSYQLILAWEKWDGASVGWNARTQSQTGNWNTLNQKNVYQSGMGISRFIVQVCVMVFMVYHGNSLYYIYIYTIIYIYCLKPWMKRVAVKQTRTPRYHENQFPDEFPLIYIRRHNDYPFSYFRCPKLKVFLVLSFSATILFSMRTSFQWLREFASS